MRAELDSSDQPIDKAQKPVLGRSSLQVFSTSLFAFILREVKNQYGRSRLGYFWALAEPGATVLVLTIMHTFAAGDGQNIYSQSPVLFFVIGAIPYFIFANAVLQTQGVCDAHRGLFNYRQVKPIDLILARAIIDAVILFLLLVGFMIVWVWLGYHFALEDPLAGFAAMLCLFLLGVGLGLLFEVLGTLNRNMRKVSGVIMRPMFFISGVFFSMGMLPDQLLFWLDWNPVFHAVDLVKGAMYANYESPASWSYVLWAVLLLHVFGLILYRRYLYRLI